MPVFTFPLALIGVIAVPALLAIYWLRSQAREYEVSSLLLWLHEKQAWEGGRKFHRLRTPLLFFLELLAILLLITAAAGPLIRAGESRGPLVIVLDDSFSMLAGNEESPRNRAARAVEGELRTDQYEPVKFVLAAEMPQLLAEGISTSGNRSEQIARVLREWKCAAPEAAMEEAIAFAYEVGGNRSRVLALTDHAPPQGRSDGRLQWWAFGSARPNVAFVNATRHALSNGDRVLIEVANLSAVSTSATISIEAINAAALNNPPSAIRHPQSISLGPNEVKRLIFTLQPDAPSIRARLSNDELGVDNELVLMSEPKKQVRVDLRVRETTLRALLEKALRSSQSVLIGTDKPELVMTDESESSSETSSGSSSESWTLWVISEKDAASFLGPFVVDRAHPLTEGLSLGGIAWGSGRSIQLPGSPVITAGDIPLLTDLERAGRHELRLRLRPDLSTLHESPNWPILIWNLIDWRARTTPGLQQANVRLGSDAGLKVESGIQFVAVTDPQGVTRQLPVRDGMAKIRAQTIGLYELNTNANRYAFAANALQREESDLTKATSGKWGDWAKAPGFQREYRSIDWFLLLPAMIVLAVHSWLLNRDARFWMRGRRDEG